MGISYLRILYPIFVKYITQFIAQISDKTESSIILRKIEGEMGLFGWFPPRIVSGDVKYLLEEVSVGADSLKTPSNYYLALKLVMSFMQIRWLNGLGDILYGWC